MRRLSLEAIVSTDEQWKNAFQLMTQMAPGLISYVDGVHLTAENLPGAGHQEKPVVTEESLYKARLAAADVRLDETHTTEFLAALERHGLIVVER